MAYVHLLLRALLTEKLDMSKLLYLYDYFFSVTVSVINIKVFQISKFALPLLNYSHFILWPTVQMHLIAM